jgi:hypothetical protein
MRRTLITILVILLWSVSMVARTPQEAAEIASQFISQRSSAIGSAQRTAAISNVDLAFTQYRTDRTTPAVFVFNSVADGGFVLVSAENESRAILGYSDHGYFDAANIPTNMQFWLQMYADELARYEANKPTLQAGQVALARNKRAASSSYPTIAPILGTMVWGQGEPYNNLCPSVNGERCVTGCVATAISQIMYVHKYPTKGTGSKSYTTETHQLNLSADFGATTYDWDNMLPYYSSGYNSTQAKAVATLLYHVGIAADMDYDPDGSGASSAISLANLSTYFGYDKGINTLPKDFMKEEDVLNAIAADLKIGHPVYVSGATKNQEGHAFVCDGMQSDGYLHINWGWYGISNGYFALSALDPEQQGTGGSASDMAFTESVEVYTGIQPDQGGVATPLMTVDKLTFTSGTEISRNAKVAISLDRLVSVGMATAAGTLSYYIYDTNDNLIQTIPIGTFELPTGYGYRDPIDVSAAIPSNVANGNYELEVGYTDNAGTIHPILVKGKGVLRTPITVTSSTITFGEGTGSGGGTTQLAAITSIDVTNVDQSNVWSIDLYSSYFWSDYASDDEVLIRLTLNSGSTTSVIGSYTMDPTNSRAAGTIDASGLYAIGYYNACYQYGIEDMHLTITDAGNGVLQVGYWVKANGQEITDVIQIEKPDWYLFNSSTGNYYFYSDNITYELASTLPASRALSMTKTLSHTHVTKMSYYVSGIISNMRNTPEQIVQYTQARFDISDDGTTNNQFYCYNTKWLGNTDFTTGNEIALGDKVIIYGPVQNYNGNTPEIKGYVYQHSKSANYEITNLKVRTEGSTVYFSFESDAPYFHVKVIDANGETTAAGIIDFKSVSLDELADGTYTLWIRPVDEAQEYYIGNAVEEQFTIDASSAVDYAIYNLNVTTEGNVAHFSWDSEAPYFHIKITYQDGTNVVNTIIDFKNAKLSDLTDGTYTVWIRPVDEAQEYYVGDAVETQFVISTTGTDVEDMHIQQTTQLYDLMGRLVDTKLSSDSRPFNVPANGIYIQRQGDSTTKIYINKQ